MNPTARVRVATWNLWWRHGDWRRRQPAIAETLRRADADVYGLQEVCTDEPDHQVVLEELGLTVVTSLDGDDDRHGIANAIASRWPVLEHEWRWLDVAPAPRHRTVLWARLQAPFGAVDVFTTHLSHGFDQSALRCRQVAEVAEFVAARRQPVDGGYPPVLLGDLNAVPESDEIRRLVGLSAPPVEGLVFSDVWPELGHGPGATYSDYNDHVVDSAWPERRLDYVMVGWPRQRPAGNPIAAERFGVDRIDGCQPSDHYGVMADLRIS